jgi:hypothetical protein
MLPLLYVGIISSSLSFSVSHFITREVLRYCYEREINKKNTSPKKDSLVRFDKTVTIQIVPSVLDRSSNTLNSLWYTSTDYDRFKLDYISGLTKYNSV